jgi:hypothetical protein
LRDWRFEDLEERLAERQERRKSRRCGWAADVRTSRIAADTLKGYRMHMARWMDAATRRRNLDVRGEQTVKKWEAKVGGKEERRPTNRLFGPNNHAIEHVLADFELT